MRHDCTNDPFDKNEIDPGEYNPYIAICNLVDVFGWHYDDALPTDLAGDDDDDFYFDDEDDYLDMYEGIGNG